MEKLFADMTSLYRLDQRSAEEGNAAGGKTELGDLPTASVILLGTLAAAWMLILLYAGIGFIKKQKNSPKVFTYFQIYV